MIPWNLCQIAAVVEDLVEDIKIIDAHKKNLSLDQLANEMGKYKPDIVGITILMDQYAPASPMITKLAKNISNDIITVLGGVYAMSNPKRAMQDKNLDYVVIGEGEYVFKQMIGYFSGVCDLPSRGICFRKNNNGELENRGHAAFIKNLDALPKPAYHLIDFLSYYSNPETRNSIERPKNFPYVESLLLEVAQKMLILSSSFASRKLF